MIYTTKELLENRETEYSIRNKVIKGELYLIERGVYSDKPNAIYRDEVLISKKYPSGILTGLSAFYIYELTDYIPSCFYLATIQHSFPIRKKDIKQSYQDSSFFEVGSTILELDEGSIKIYDLERLLIELVRLKEKYPKEIYYEVINSYRKIKDSLDFYKLNEYLKSFSNGNNLLLKIKEII